MTDTKTAEAEAEPRAACLCGCGNTPKHKKSRFMPGHDAQLKARLYATVRDEQLGDEARQLARDTIDGFEWPQPAPKKAKKTKPAATNGEAEADTGEVTPDDL